MISDDGRAGEATTRAFPGLYLFKTKDYYVGFVPDEFRILLNPGFSLAAV
jgi:hypothetical protein